jgi:hypothetical protein
LNPPDARPYIGGLPEYVRRFEESAMAKSLPVSPVPPLQQIGETAGAVWHALREQGPLSLAKLVETVGANRDVVMQAIGWLAREDKVEMTETKRGRIVSLREAN